MHEHSHTDSDAIPASVRDTAATVVIALAGGGCSPCIFDAMNGSDPVWHALDWAAGDGPFDPVAVADRLGHALSARRGATVLAGHSLGGFIALLVAMRHPACVQALIVSNTGPRLLGHGDPDLPARIRAHWDAAMQAEFLRACFETEPPAPLWAEMTAYIAQLPAEHLLQAVTGLRRLDISDDLRLVRCPTLVAHGERDRRRPLASAEHLACGIADARLALLPGGHTPMVDCPLEYRIAVQGFLADIGLGPGGSA